MQQTIEAYFQFSLKLKAKPRRGSGNMFRHQMETFAILLEYGYTDSILLKASLIHDLIEDSKHIGFADFGKITEIDKDGSAVYKLVSEVSQRLIEGEKEPKAVFLLRIMQQASPEARILKLADRISNVNALLLSGDNEFILNYMTETENYIMPYSANINAEMADELINSLQHIKKLFYGNNN